MINVQGVDDPHCVMILGQALSQCIFPLSSITEWHQPSVMAACDGPTANR